MLTLRAKLEVAKQSGSHVIYIRLYSLTLLRTEREVKVKKTHINFGSVDEEINNQ